MTPLADFSLFGSGAGPPARNPGCDKAPLNLLEVTVMNRRRGLALCAIVASIIDVHAFGSDWKEKPTPYFPPAALERNLEGAVVLRVIVNKEGAVHHAVVSRSSGDRALDEAARLGVFKWKMKPNAI